MQIYFYRDADFYYDVGYYFDVDLIGETWSIQIPAFEQETTFYLGAYGREDVSFNYYDAPAGSITVKDSDMSDIELDVYLPITLSGTVSFDRPVNSITVTVYRGAYYGEELGWTYADIGDGNKWSINITAFNTDTTVYFRVSGYDTNNKYFGNEARSITVKNTDIDDIELALSTITLSGVLNVIEGDDTYSDLEIYFGKEKDLSWYTTTGINSDGSFSVSLTSVSQGTTIYVSAYIELDDSYGMVILDTVDVKDADISGLSYTIDLTKFITISGTVAYDEPLSWMYVDFYLDPDPDLWFWGTSIDPANNTWFVKIPAFVQDTTLYVTVFGEEKVGAYRFTSEAGSVSVGNVNKENIEIIPGTFFSGEYIFLSGTLDLVSTTALDYAYVNARTSDGRIWSYNEKINSFPGTWVIQIPKFSEKKAIEFRVTYYLGSTGRVVSTDKWIIVTDSDVSGIELTF